MLAEVSLPAQWVPPQRTSSSSSIAVVHNGSGQGVLQRIVDGFAALGTERLSEAALDAALSRAERLPATLVDALKQLKGSRALLDLLHWVAPPGSGASRAGELGGFRRALAVLKDGPEICGAMEAMCWRVGEGVWSRARLEDELKALQSGGREEKVLARTLGKTYAGGGVLVDLGSIMMAASGGMAITMEGLVRLRAAVMGRINSR